MLAFLHNSSEETRASLGRLFHRGRGRRCNSGTRDARVPIRSSTRLPFQGFGDGVADLSGF